MFGANQRPRATSHRFIRTGRRGYTLLELILALGLAVIILGAVAGAIHTYMMVLTKQQSYIEHQQVARSVLMMIANDLRGGLQYKAADVSGLEDLAVSQALIAGLMGGGAGGTGTPAPEDTGGTGGTPTGGTPTGGAPTGGAPTGGAPTGDGVPTDGATGGTTGDESESSTATEDTAAYRPLMIGTGTQLVVDVSRLPRVDQYNSFMLGLDPQSQTPSDLKSIAYFIAGPNTQKASQEFDPAVAELGGLYRRQIDRAVAEYRGETSGPTSPDEFSTLVAPEITAIEFRYYDGSDWLTEWDSEEQQFFPLAIEVVITIDGDRVANARRNGPTANIESSQENLRQYRLVVHLPAAEVPPEEEEGSQ